jgi:pimeloyl-ACP methyl ester carboxylesterase
VSEPHSWRLRVAGDTEISGREAGEGSPPIVLLHGRAGNRRWWDPVAGLLAPRRRVAWWDHRGHGRSGPARGDCTVEQLAEDTLAVLDERELGQVVLVGHSLGAAVALVAAAVAGPERVGAVMCVDGGLYDPRLLFGRSWEQAREALRSPRRPLSEAVVRAWLPTSGLPPEALGALLDSFAATGDGRLAPRLSAADEETLAHSMWSQDLPAVLGAVQVPVALLAADVVDDRGVRRRMESIARARRLLGGALTESWVASGHDLPLARPVVVAGAIERLAARTWGGLLVRSAG